MGIFMLWVLKTNIQETTRYLEKVKKLSASAEMSTAEIFPYGSYYQNASLCKKIDMHMHALTYFIAYMQTNKG